jgi:hypothetical protein
MHTNLHAAANPFALMLDPEAVLDRIAHSDRLERLQRRVCRPLDKPLLDKVGAGEDAGSDDTDLEGDDALAELQTLAHDQADRETRLSAAAADEADDDLDADTDADLGEIDLGDDDEGETEFAGLDEVELDGERAEAA